MIRRTLVSCAAGALALFFILTPAVPQAQGRGGGPTQGQGGPIADLQQRVQALEEAVADLSTDVSALGVDLQGKIDVLSANLAVLRGGIGTLTVDMTTLTTRVADLEATVAALGGGLTSYDQLAGLPCTTASGMEGGTIGFWGLYKSPVCGIESENGRFLDLGSVVLDTQTNLMWEKKTRDTEVWSGQNVDDLHDMDNRYNWCQATGNSTGVCSGNATSWIGQVNAEVFAGFSNWRVPTRDELLTIVDTSVATCGSGTPCIDPIFGPTTWSDPWWSSTEADSLSSAEVAGLKAWFVSFYNGLAWFDSKDYYEFPVRAVRVGP